MSPIVHGEISWLLGASLPDRRDRLLITCAGVLPDLDGLTLLAGVDAYVEYHHVLTHGYPAALVTALVCGMLAKRKAAVVVLALLAFHLHLLCDLVGSGPGWPLHYFWPTSDRAWFWDGQWDLASWQNSVIGLTTTLAVLASSLWWRRTMVELISPRWDAEVVATVRRRILGAGSTGSP